MSSFITAHSRQIFRQASANTSQPAEHISPSTSSTRAIPSIIITSCRKRWPSTLPAGSCLRLKQLRLGPQKEGDCWSERQTTSSILTAPTFSSRITTTASRSRSTCAPVLSRGLTLTGFHLIGFVRWSAPTHESNQVESCQSKTSRKHRRTGRSGSRSGGSYATAECRRRQDRTGGLPLAPAIAFLLRPKPELFQPQAGPGRQGRGPALPTGGDYYRRNRARTR